MKRVHFFLAMVFATALLGLFAGCGKLEDQEPSVKEKSAGTNDAGNGSAPMTLADGKTMPVAEAEAAHSLVMHDGTIYEGEMKGGKPNGLGTVTDARGTYQKGEWRDGRIYRVSGTCVLPDGTKEEGTWNNDGTTCGGTIWWPDGHIYKGDWVVTEGRAESPYGMGTMTWPDGRQYAGHFVNGKMDGAGKMTYPDGKVEDGAWVQDAFQGAAK
jgi:hypothetical protein